MKNLQQANFTSIYPVLFTNGTLENERSLKWERSRSKYNSQSIFFEVSLNGMEGMYR